jgi:hypothetical protein
MRHDNALNSADSGVANQTVRSLIQINWLARGWADISAARFPLLSADIAWSAKLSTLLSVTGPAARSRR